MSWFVYVIRVGVDEPTPGRQSAVRDHVMRRLCGACRNPNGAGLWLSRDSATRWDAGMEDKARGRNPAAFQPHPPAALLPSRVRP